MKDLENYGEWGNIKRAINSACPDFDYSILRPCIWKDEIGDIFFLTQCMEIYFYDKTTLRCICWSRKYGHIIRKLSQFPFITGTDDGLYVFEANITDFCELLTFVGRVKKRTRKKSAKIAKLELKLCHKIKSVGLPLQKGERKKETPDCIKPYLFKRS